MKVMRHCPICGKEFNPCRRGISVTGQFNWREVTCSFECGKKYLAKIEEEKQPSTASEFVQAVTEDIEDIKISDVVVEDDGSVDEIIENSEDDIDSKNVIDTIDTTDTTEDDEDDSEEDNTDEDSFEDE